MPTLHQFTEAAAPGDAITDQALQLRQWLRQMGYTSDIYTIHLSEELNRQVKPLSAYRATPGEKYLIYHHGIGSEVVNHLLHLTPKIILIYHNVTPPEFFTSLDPALAHQLQWGREQLPLLVPRTHMALGVSAYNQAELQSVGFFQTGVLPIALNEQLYRTTPVNPQLVQQLQTQKPLLLFIGRLVPNKRQEDLIKLLYYVRRIEPQTRLALVGIPWSAPYSQWLHDLTSELNLTEAVIFTDHVSFADMVTYYQMADLYVSMSEHEGFGKPLIESMFFDLPILAYASSGIPGTLGDAGILFHNKNFEALAELVCMLLHDQSLRHKLLVRQRERGKFYQEAEVQTLWQQLISNLPLSLREN
jgi:glycosyltransferase involved in cell wall biosynthesis